MGASPLGIVEYTFLSSPPRKLANLTGKNVNKGDA
jgi:hypothetical protein